MCLSIYANENYRKLERPKIKLIKENSKFKLLKIYSNLRQKCTIFGFFFLINLQAQIR